MTPTDINRASRVAAKAVLAAAGGARLQRSERRQHQLLALAATLDGQIIDALAALTGRRRTVH